MKNTFKFYVCASLATLALGSTAFGQSADALIDKLVEKGILSVKEGNVLREEADRNFTTSYQIKSGMPDWVTALKFGGDLRLRYDGIYSDHPAFVDRSRLRYRFRFGAVATLKDNFDIGFRLISGENAKGGFTSIDPISGNASFEDNGSKKLIGIDQVFARWTPINTANWSVALTGGKMENPFVFSDIVFDADYTPEGAAQQIAYTLNDRHIFRFNVGEFVLDEMSGSNRDPFLLGAQVRWDANWSPQFQSTVGLAAMAISSKDGLPTANVPDQNGGNTRDASGNLIAHFNPIVADAAFIYNVEKFPLYPGAFPIRVGGEYLYNPGASTKNQAYAAGIQFGKAGKKGTWEIAYRWKSLEADSWYEELVDSDTGAFYQAPMVGGKTGYAPGTNLRGHWLRAAWSPFDSFTFSATYYLFELINASPKGSNSEVGRLQVDAMWKF
jgi:hypothetical protein